MKKLYLILLIFIGLHGFNFAQGIDYDKRLIVQFHSTTGAQDVIHQSAASRSIPLNWKKLSGALNIYLLNWTDDSSLSEMKDYLSKYSEILLIQRDAEVYTRNGREPNDPEANVQWYLDRIRAKRAWTQSTGGINGAGDTIVVAVLEREGPEILHEDLVNQFWVNKSEIPNDGIDNDNNGYVDDYKGLNIGLGTDKHPADISSHATPVCGIIGAEGNNQLGVAGVNWNIKILMISNVQNVSKIIESYQYIIDMRLKYNQSNGAEGAYVVSTNASFGRDGDFPEQFPLWCEMFESMGELGILTAVATSNSNVDIATAGDMPTLCPSPFIIGVTNTNSDDNKAKEAGYSKLHIDIGAPGINIHTTNPNNSYSVAGGSDGGGTSFAAPMVTGAIALMYSMPSPEFSEFARTKPAEAGQLIKQYILDGVDKNTNLEERTLSGGRLNLEKSMILLSKAYGNIEDELTLFKLMPNPARNRLRYAFKANEFVEYDILVVNMLGQVVLQEKVNPIVFGDPELELDISRLVPGQYLFTVRNQKEVKSKLFIKMEDL